MSATGSIVVFFTLWFLTMLAIISIGVRTQDEAGSVEPGTHGSAPENPRLGLKMLIATGIAGALWLAAKYVIDNQIITIDDLAAIWGL